MQQLQTTIPLGSILRERYIIEGLLGKGGYGSVYLVRDLRVKGNLFALKETRSPEKKDHQRFLFEGELLKRLDHHALPRVYRVFEDESYRRTFMLMDYVEGPNLEALRQRQLGNRFTLARVLAIMAPIADAVAYLHNQQPPVLHRDIKPSNIIVPVSGDDAVLVDFGIAKECTPDGTTTAFRTGSPGYAAPEQYSQGTNARSDIYGLGATFYTLLTGALPVDALLRMTTINTGQPDPLLPAHRLNPALAQPVVQAIHRAMSLNANERFATVEQFWQAFAAQQGWRPLGSLAMPVVSIGISSATTDEMLPKSQPLSRPPLTSTPIPPVMTPSPAEQYAPRRSKRLILLPLLLLLALVILSGAFVSAFAYFTNHSLPGFGMTQPTTVVTIVKSASSPVTLPTAIKTTGTTHARPTPISRPAITPTARATNPPTPTMPPVTPTPRPTPPTPTPTPIPYTNVAGNYSGTVDNTTSNIITGMSLSIQQRSSQSVITGYFTVNPPLVGSGNFTGTVTTTKYVQFIVQSYHGNAPLYFWGWQQADGSLRGGYCSINARSQCDSTVGASGTWDAAPVISPLALTTAILEWS